MHLWQDWAMIGVFGPLAQSEDGKHKAVKVYPKAMGKA